MLDTGFWWNWWAEIMSAGLLLPILWYVMKKHQENFESIIQSQKERDNELKKTFEKWFVWIQMAIWKKTIESWDIATDISWRFYENSAIKKIDFIEKRLQKNNIQERLNEIISSILIECKKIDDDEVYRPLNAFNTKIWNLWYELKENYDYDWFINEIKDVIVSWSSNETKITDIKTVLKSYQSKVLNEISLQFNIR